MAASLRPTLLRQLTAAPSQHAASAIPSFRSYAHPMQRAAFQTSAKRAILPPLPQKIEGTVNDPAPVPAPHPSHGSYHWTADRIISAALVPISIAPFAAGSLNPLLDSTLIGVTLLHTYLGFQTCITDYFPGWRVPKTRKLFEYTNLIAMFLAGWGFYEFETHDVGLTAGIARIWRGGDAPK